MSKRKLQQELEDLMRSIRNNDFKHSKEELFDAQPKKAPEREPNEGSDLFDNNSSDISEDRRPVDEPDPYQVEVDKINQRTNDAKRLSESDMRDIEEIQAHQNVKNLIFQNRMRMASQEGAERAKQREEAKAREEAYRNSRPLTPKEKFIEAFTKKKDRGRGR